MTPSSLPLRIGLIGCGRIAQEVHLPVLRALPDVHLVALADLNSAQLHEAAQQAPGAVPYGDGHTLIDRASVEAVVICAPPAAHAPLACCAFEAGLHVYVEKPLCPSLSEALDVLDAWRAAKTVGQIGFNYRFDPLHQQAHELLLQNAIGEVVGVRTVFSSASRTLPVWKRGRGTGGGVLMDLGSHHVDLVTHLLDASVTDVSAHLRSDDSEDDGAALMMHLSNGVVVQSLFSMRTVSEDRFEFYGRTGKLSYDRLTSAAVEVTNTGFSYGRVAQVKRELNTLRHSLRRAVQSPGETSFRAAFAAFAAATRGQSVDIPTLEDGYRALQTLLAAEETGTHSGVSSVAVV